MAWTKEQKNAWQREYRRRTHNANTQKYEKTPKGFLMRLYRNMESRITGIQKLKHHLYAGKELLSRQDFYDWATSNPDFMPLFQAWEESNYDQRLTPSVDRIDSSKGYTVENMRWLTHSENSRLGSIERNRLYEA